MTALLTNALVVLGLWAATRHLQAFRLVEYTYLVLEDGWVEYGSFAAWTLSAVLFFWAGAKAPKGFKAVHFLLAVAALFLAMEEISWFQRVVGWRGPEILTGRNRQGETNLHNLVLLSDVYRPLAAGLLVWMVTPWLLARRLVRWRGFCQRWAMPLVPPRLWPWFLLAAVFLAELFIPRPHEVGELFLAMAVSALALDRLIPRGAGVSSRITLPMVPVVVLAVLFAATMLTTAVFPEPGARVFERSLYRLGRQRLVVGRPSQAVPIFEYLAAHPKPYLEDTPLFYGLSLLASGRGDESRTILERYLESSDVEPDGLLDPSTPLPGATKAQRFGLALCATERRSEAKELFERIENTLRENLIDPPNRRAELRSRGQLSEILLARGQFEQARSELAEALSIAAPRKAADLRSRFRETERLVGLVKCL